MGQIRDESPNSLPSSMYNTESSCALTPSPFRNLQTQATYSPSAEAFRGPGAGLARATWTYAQRFVVKGFLVEIYGQEIFGRDRNFAEP
jgi:hypothetical protein